MQTFGNKKTLRQMRYLQRSSRARMYAWMLVPVTIATFSAAAWSDPVLGPRLLSGLEEIKPRIESLLERVPGAAEQQDATAGDVDEAASQLASLPNASTPVNRP
jgi:hypothetical protein